MNQLQFPAIICNWLKTWELSRVHSAIGFGLASHWLKNWRESFKAITKRRNRNHVITFDCHLGTALTLQHSFYRLRCVLQKHSARANELEISLCQRQKKIRAKAGQGPFSRKSQPFSGLFRVPQFPLYPNERLGSKPSNFAILLVFLT